MVESPVLAGGVVSAPLVRRHARSDVPDPKLSVVDVRFRGSNSFRGRPMKIEDAGICERVAEYAIASRIRFVRRLRELRDSAFECTRCR